MPKHSHFFSGLSALQLQVPKYQFPAEFQQSSRLTYYSTFFNSIEINSTFYKIPMTSTIARWSASVHENFKFTFKLFKEISHCKNLDFDRILISRFMQTIIHAGNKRGCLLVQFPPSITFNYVDQISRILSYIIESDVDRLWKVAVEFRHKSWYNEDVYELLESKGAALVIHDMPASATPFIATAPDFMYVRFHGPTGNYRGSYTDSFLAEHAGYVKEWLEDGKEVYVYFNNTAGDAFANAMALSNF